MFTRRLFSKRWQPKLSKLCQNFFFDIVRELSDIFPKHFNVHFLVVCAHLISKDEKTDTIPNAQKNTVSCCTVPSA
jgi:hypothetical protein